jgi:hypothetical protein
VCYALIMRATIDSVCYTYNTVGLSQRALEHVQFNGIHVLRPKRSARYDYEGVPTSRLLPAPVYFRLNLVGDT